MKITLSASIIPINQGSETKTLTTVMCEKRSHINELRFLQIIKSSKENSCANGDSNQRLLTLTGQMR